MVISVPAGDQTAMVALDKMTGEFIWKSGSPGGMRSYVTPVLFRNDTINQIIGITTRQVFAVDAGSGEIQWKYDLSGRIAEVKNEKPGDNIYVNSPIIKGNQVYVSQGYDNISVMLEYTGKGKGVKELWIDRTLDCHIHGVIEIDGYIYGSNWYNNRDGRWVCLVWESGEVRYVNEWNGKGATVSADGMMYLYDEKQGHVGLARPNRDSLEIVTSFEVDFGEGQHWAHPFIGEGKLIIRHGESIGIYRLTPSVASLQSQ
jgi:outer membrane protein assembly factor BamB